MAQILVALFFSWPVTKKVFHMVWHLFDRLIPLGYSNKLFRSRCRGLWIFPTLWVVQEYGQNPTVTHISEYSTSGNKVLVTEPKCLSCQCIPVQKNPPVQISFANAAGFGWQLCQPENLLNEKTFLNRIGNRTLPNSVGIIQFDPKCHFWIGNYKWNVWRFEQKLFCEPG